MDQAISAGKLEEASQMDLSTDNLFSFNHNRLKSDSCCGRKTCIFALLCLLLLAMCSAAVAMSAVALWSSKGWEASTILMDSSNDGEGMDSQALYEVK